MSRRLAAQLHTYLCRCKPHNLQSHNFSSLRRKDEVALEKEAERKIGWLLKLIFAGTATFVAYQFMPYMGDNLVQQSIALLQVKDPFFKRSGASRLASFAVDDEKRMKIVEMGGAQHLVSMLETANDDNTRKVALKAINALCQSDEAARALRHAGALSIVMSVPDSIEETEIGKYKSSLISRFEHVK